MPSNCAVFGCFNTYKKTKDSKIKYHHFPKNKAYRNQWVHACCRADTINTEYAIVCSIHFKPEDYKDDLKSRLLGIGITKHHRLLKEDAVPTFSTQWWVKFYFIMSWRLCLYARISKIHRLFVWSCETWGDVVWMVIKMMKIINLRVIVVAEKVGE